MKLIFALMIFGVTLSFSAQSIEFEEIAYGLYKAKNKYTKSNDDILNGEEIISENYGFYKITDSIPAILGIHFGVAYILKSNKNKIEDIEIVWKYPKDITDTRGKTFSESRRTVKQYSNTAKWTGYSFTDDYELLPGKWILEIRHRRKLIYKREFIIFKPESKY